MQHLEFEEKLAIKDLAEKFCYSSKYEEKYDSLKGSLTVEQKEFIENLLREKKYYYLDEEKNEKLFREAKAFSIGKSIVIMKNDLKIVFEVISLKNYDAGIEEYNKFVEKKNQVYMENIGKEKENEEKLNEFIEQFKNTRKSEKIERGRILIEIDTILSPNKERGIKTNTWKRLGISSTEKSMLCKRYNLFKEFQANESFLENKNFSRDIDNLTDLELKEIGKESLSIDDKILKFWDFIEKKEGKVI